VTIRVTAEQRNILHQQLMARLGGIDAIVYAVDEKNFDLAERLSREFSDLLLVLNELGLGAGTGTEVEVTVPREAVRRVLERVHSDATLRGQDESVELQEVEESRAETLEVANTCEILLGAMG
jgi:hypothetical protein